MVHTWLLGCLSGLALLAAGKQRSWVVLVMTVLLLTSVVLSTTTTFWTVDPVVSLLTLLGATVLLASPLHGMPHLWQLTWLLTIHLIAVAVTAFTSLVLLSVLALVWVVSRLLRQQPWLSFCAWLLLCLLGLTGLFNQTLLWLVVAQICWLIVVLCETPAQTPSEQAGSGMSEVDAEAIRTGERSRIYQNIHDDVGSDLLKLIYNTQDPDQREAIKNIMSRLRQAVARTEHRQVNLAELVAEICAETATSCEAAGLQFTSSTEVTTHPLDLDLPVHLQRMFRELTSNAIKHARATNLHFTASTQDGLLKTTLSDDGVGWSDDQDTADALSKGLKSLRRRAAQHGARIDWKSAPGEGTTVNIEVPLP